MEFCDNWSLAIIRLLEITGGSLLSVPLRPLMVLYDWDRVLADHY